MVQTTLSLISESVLNNALSLIIIRLSVVVPEFVHPIVYVDEAIFRFLTLNELFQSHDAGVLSVKPFNYSEYVFDRSKWFNCFIKRYQSLNDVVDVNNTERVDTVNVDQHENKYTHGCAQKFGWTNDTTR